MKRIISVFSVIIIVVIALSACAQNNIGGESGNTTDNVTQTTTPSYINNMSDKTKNSIMGSWTVTMNKVDFVYNFGETTGTIKIGDDIENITPYYSSDDEFVWKIDSRETYFAYKPQVKDKKLILTPLYFIKDGQKYIDDSGVDMILTKAN